MRINKTRSEFSFNMKRFEIKMTQIVSHIVCVVSLMLSAVRSRAITKPFWRVLVFELYW